MDEDTRKIMTVIAAFDEEHQRLKIAIAALMKVTGQISGELKGSAKEAITEALKTLHPQIDQANQTLASLHRYSVWLVAWQHAIVAAVAILVTLAGVWWYVPPASEIAALRTEKDELQASLEELNKRGAKMKAIGCGPQKRLCVLVDRTAGTFGVAGNKDDEYMIVKGY